MYSVGAWLDPAWYLVVAVVQDTGLIAWLSAAAIVLIFALVVLQAVGRR